PAWTVDGQLVRTADGSPLADGLQPANQAPVLALGSGPAEVTDESRGGVVLEYLRNVREAAAGEREVMLRFLGTPSDSQIVGIPAAMPPTSGAEDHARRGLPHPGEPGGSAKAEEPRTEETQNEATQ